MVGGGRTHWSRSPHGPCAGAPQAFLLLQPGVRWGSSGWTPSLRVQSRAWPCQETGSLGGACRRHAHLDFGSHEGLREARILEASAAAESLGVECPPPPLPFPPLPLTVSQVSPGLRPVFFSLCHVACGILVPSPGIKHGLPSLEARRLNHWTIRDDPCLF